MSTSNIARGILLVAYLLCPRLDNASSYIVYQTKDSIMIAADSKMSGGGGVEARDDACKIALVNKRIAVFITGRISVNKHDLIQTASNVASNSQFRGQGDLDEMARKWQREAHAAYQEIISADGNDYGRYLDSLSGKEIVMSTVTFAGFDQKGVPVFSSAGVMPVRNQLGFLEVQDAGPKRGEDLGLPLGTSVAAFALGYSTLDELRKGESERSKEKAGVLIQITAARSLKERQGAVVAFTKLAHDWNKEEVDGPTDVLYISRRNAKWLSLKANCPTALNHN